NDPNFDPATLAGNGSTIPAATAVATFAPAGDCGGPAGFGNCYGYEINAHANLPGRPAVGDQPLRAGHPAPPGSRPRHPAWTTQEERLVLNAVLFPAGPANAALNTSRLPRVAERPMPTSGGVPMKPTDRDRP